MREEERPTGETPSADPSPSEEPINAGVEVDSSTASEKASSADSPFISDAGPGFNPEHAEPGPEAPPSAELHSLPELEPGWEEEVVQTLLTTQGQLMHGAIGVAEYDWLHTQADLVAIAGPLTRILNRYEPTRAAAAMGDPVALALGMGAYGVRSVRERQEVLKAIGEEEEVPVTGVPAPPGSGPPADDLDPTNLDWQRG